LFSIPLCSLAVAGTRSGTVQMRLFYDAAIISQKARVQRKKVSFVRATKL
jgi:hypothetical protein